jgi:hypothetical protein
VKTTGTVRVPTVAGAAAKTYTLKAVTTMVAGAESATVRLRLGPKTRAAIRRALRAGKRVTASLRIRITDGAGNTRTRTRQIRLTL